MSLLYWFPLNGDLHSQGLKNIILTNQNSVSINANGKIGSCYEFNGSNQRLYSEEGLSMASTSISLAFWAKIDSSATANSYVGGLSKASNPNFMAHYNYSTKALSLYINGTQQLSFQITNYVDSWHHYVLCSDSTSIYIYIDGELKAQKVYTVSTLTTSYLNIGARRNSNSTGAGYFKGLINDFRIYDHCLSLKEIKELYKGLILHYPLNYMNLINKDTLTKNTSINDDGDTKNSSGWFATDFIPVFSNHIYQTYKLSTGGSNTYIAFYNNAKVKTRTVLIVANQDNTLIPDSTEAFIRLSIRNLSNELKTALFYEIPTIIYDSSGYSNNGTVIGDLSAVVPSPRYNYATIFSNNCYIKKTDLAYDLNIWSASCWFKKTSTVTSSFETMFAFTKGSGADANKKFSLYIKDDAVGFVGEQSSHNSIALIDKNLWHHVCITSDGIKHKYYLDGILKKTYDRTTNLTGCTDFVVGGRAAAEDANSLGTPWGGNLSDIRFYITALSDEDVLELYNTSGSIDSQGNIYARNFISQEDASFSISKNGIVVSPNFYECENNQASISNNNQKEIVGYQFYEY